MEVVVEYDYVGQEDDELSLKEGDVINDVIKMDGGWWEGTLNGKRGMFPDNFVKVQEVKKENVRVKEAPGAPKQDSSGGHVAEMASRLANEGGIRMGGQSAPGITKRISTGPAVVPPTNRQNSREPSIDNESKDKVFAKVTFHYTPQQKDELKLVKGDIVEVIKQEEEGWWEGVLNGRSGVFPSHFVELLSEAKPKGEGFEEIKGKKIKGVGLGNIFSEGPIKLRKGQLRGGNQEMEEEPTAACRTKLRDKGSPPVEPKNMQNKGVPLPSVPRDVPAVPPKEAKELKSVEKARVLFEYTAANKDELTMEEGDVIVVLSKDLEDPGWWKGQLNGKVGVFPDNFVELLPPDEKPKKPPPPPVATSGGHESRAPPTPPPPHSPPVLRTKAAPTPASASVPTPTPSESPRKKDDTKDAKPGWKPAVPPPVGKKPIKQGDQKLFAQTDGAQENDHNGEQQELDEVESVEKLSHITANRARAPQRRPPNLKAREVRNGTVTIPVTSS